MKVRNLIICLTQGLLALNIATAEPDPAAMAKAEELFEVMDIDKQLMGGFDAMMPMIEQMAASWNLDEEAKTELEAI